uniref:Uncharacterized protein n=1 Tax=Glossina austeni TaxID=7395 RepID=A0A1A9UX53_GLOAU
MKLTGEANSRRHILHSAHWSGLAAKPALYAMLRLICWEQKRGVVLMAASTQSISWDFICASMQYDSNQILSVEMIPKISVDGFTKYSAHVLGFYKFYYRCCQAAQH